MLHDMAKGIEMFVFEPALKAAEFYNVRARMYLAAFEREVDVIIANRSTAALDDVAEMVYRRGLVGRNA